MIDKEENGKTNKPTLERKILDLLVGRVNELEHKVKDQERRLLLLESKLSGNGWIDK